MLMDEPCPVRDHYVVDGHHVPHQYRSEELQILGERTVTAPKRTTEKHAMTTMIRREFPYKAHVRVIMVTIQRHDQRLSYSKWCE